MKITIPFLVLIAVLICGCGEEKRLSPNQSSSENQQMSVIQKERPALDFMGAYNIPAKKSNTQVGPFWSESEKLKELSLKEFYAVRTSIVEALSKHATVYGEVEGATDFFVYEDKFFDRTQKIEVKPSAKLPELLPVVVSELQDVLKLNPLWRVMFIGEGDDVQSRLTYFVVYPDLVRIAQLSDQKTLSEAVKENASMRFRMVEERMTHWKQRKTDLRESIIKAIDRLEQSEDNVLLVAWYDSLSDSHWNEALGGEGRPGSQIWLLFRSADGDKQPAIDSEVQYFAPYWATKDGNISSNKPESEKSHVLRMFENDKNVISDLEVQIDGVKRSFTRPGK